MQIFPHIGYAFMLMTRLTREINLYALLTNLQLFSTFDAEHSWPNGILIDFLNRQMIHDPKSANSSRESRRWTCVDATFDES